MVKEVFLRLANASDKELLLQWANDATCRKNSFSTNKITPNEHEKWFTNIIASENISLFILMVDNKEAGQIRIDRKDGVGYISYSLACQYRGMGLGKIAILLLENEIMGSVGKYYKIRAEVKSGNISSQKIFEELGYNKMVNGESYEYSKSASELIYHNVKESVIECIHRGGGGVLVLSNNRNSIKLYDWILMQGEDAVLFSDKIEAKILQRLTPQYVISYNYSHIIDDECIKFMNGRMINLHISYLPWNKGADPNFWSFIENTPKGVSIHKIDHNLDTGDILVQQELDFKEGIETFATTYKKLNEAILKLFMDNWYDIKTEQCIAKKQFEKGSYHSKKDLERIIPREVINWNETIISFKVRFGLNS